MSGHKFKIGQLLNYPGREHASGLYQVTQLLPPEGDVFQYRIGTPTSRLSASAKESDFVRCDLHLSQGMPPFDYNAPAELFLAKPTKGSRENYLRFATAAGHPLCRRGFAHARAFGAWLEVGDERFNSNDIQRLYEASEYPLRKPE